MMRSPRFLAIAVRRPDQKIVLRSFGYQSILKRFPILAKPVFRGIVGIIESLMQGIDALSFSAQVLAESEDEGKPLSAGAVAVSIISAIALGLTLFVVIPHVVTALLLSGEPTASSTRSPIFHLVDGGIKLGILLLYIYAITLMKDIYRVFQYHGAEHKSIYTFEAGEDLTVENARKHSRLHPRCGTSFLLALVMVSILVFSVVFPVFHLDAVSERAWVGHVLVVLVKILLMLPIGGLAYEALKWSAARMGNPLLRAVVWPGLQLQNLTTREPDDEQLEVALISLRQVLRREKMGEVSVIDGEMEQELAHLSELGAVKATVSEFPEL